MRRANLMFKPTIESRICGISILPQGASRTSRSTEISCRRVQRCTTACLVPIESHCAAFDDKRRIPFSDDADLMTFHWTNAGVTDASYRPPLNHEVASAGFNNSSVTGRIADTYDVFH